MSNSQEGARGREYINTGEYTKSGVGGGRQRAKPGEKNIIMKTDKTRSRGNTNMWGSVK